MIKPKFALFQVQQELLLVDAVKLCQPHFSKTPETLDAIDMVPALCELICTMINTIMLVVTDVDETVVSLPSIGVNDAFQIDMATDNSFP